MKKTIANHILIFLLSSLSLILSTFFCISTICYRLSHPNFSAWIIASIFFAIVLFLSLIANEFITFYDDRIVSRKVYRRIEIKYDEIESLTYVGAGGVPDEKAPTTPDMPSAWRIIDVHGRKIYILNFLKRKNLILPLQQILERKDNQ